MDEAPAVTSEESTPPEDGQENAVVKHAREIQGFLRQLIIAEKNFALYPPNSKVLLETFDKLLKLVQACLELTGPLRLSISKEGFLIEKTLVFTEGEGQATLAFRLQKDGVREMTFLPDVTRAELLDLVECIHAAKKTVDDEDDFVSLFWEKDTIGIQMQITDDLVDCEDLPQIRERTRANAALVHRFRVPEAERDELLEDLEKHAASDSGSDDEGRSEFEISDEEAAQLQERVSAEQEYSPLYDFVQILLEVMIKDPDPKAFSSSVATLRTILISLIEDMDFERAAFVVEYLTSGEHPGLAQAHGRQLREMVETLSDKTTLAILERFLDEHESLSADHPVFVFMKNFRDNAVAAISSFLRFHQHIPALIELLGAGKPANLGVYQRRLDDPDPGIACAVIEILVRLRAPDLLRLLGRALEHRDGAVRLAAAEAIKKVDRNGAAARFVKLLKEESNKIVRLALDFFCLTSYPESFEAIRELIVSRRFYKLDKKHQHLCFRALLKADSKRAAEFMFSELLGRVYSLTAGSRNRKAAALMALSEVDSPRRIEILERFAAAWRSTLAPVARQVLTTIHRARAQARKAKAGQTPSRTRATHV